MRNAQQVLTMLGIEKTKYNMQHCKMLVDIFRLFTNEKKNIVSVSVTPKQYMFARSESDHYDSRTKEWETKVSHEGKDTAGQKFTVTTHRGNYSVTVPDKTPVYNSFCNLLGVEFVPIEVKKEKVLKTFTFPAEMIDTIKNAKVFTGDDGLRPVFKTVLIEIEKGKAVVVATNAHRLYLSQKFKVTGPAGKFSCMLKVDELKKFPQPTEESFQFEVHENSVSFLGVNIGLYDDSRFPDYRVVTPSYEKGITFNRRDFVSTVKQILPLTNKSTYQIFITINGFVGLAAQDVDFSFEGQHRMSWIKKEVPDMFISFNGKFLLDALNSFECDEITMLTEGKSQKCGIFTDGINKVLIMPLYWEGQEDALEVFSEPIKIESKYANNHEKIRSKRGVVNKQFSDDEIQELQNEFGGRFIFSKSEDGRFEAVCQYQKRDINIRGVKTLMEYKKKLKAWIRNNPDGVTIIKHSKTKNMKKVKSKFSVAISNGRYLNGSGKDLSVTIDGVKSLKQFREKVFDAYVEKHPKSKGSIMYGLNESSVFTQVEKDAVKKVYVDYPNINEFRTKLWENWLKHNPATINPEEDTNSNTSNVTIIDNDGKLQKVNNGNEVSGLSEEEKAIYELIELEFINNDN